MIKAWVVAGGEGKDNGSSNTPAEGNSFLFIFLLVYFMEFWF